MDARKHNKITRLIKNAGFRQLATIEELDTHESRGISSRVIDQLSRGEYLKYGGTIEITCP